MVRILTVPGNTRLKGIGHIRLDFSKNQSAYKMILLVLQARQHRKFAVEEGDHLTMLNVYEAFVKVSQSGEIAGMGGT